MTFLNPWGLLALLAVPVILGLHFFRQQRKHRQIGGLHLWDFARIATPAGRRFERLHSSLPLLFQLLAAILLALLLARLDMPTKQAARTYTIVLDDSVSMLARTGGKSAAERAKAQLAEWAPSGDKYTVVLAGTQAEVAAGPAASRQEFLQWLSSWTPASDFADVTQAMNIAQKFSAGEGKLIFVSDGAQGSLGLHAADKATEAAPDPKKGTPTAGAAAGAVEWTTGRAAENRAIVFADRFRPSAEQERIVASVQRFGGIAGTATLKVFDGAAQVLAREVDLATTAPVSVQLDFAPTDAPLRLEISPGGALAADDVAVLRPGVVKPVRVFVDSQLPQAAAFEKAALAVPEVSIAKDAASAELLFADAGSTVTPGGAAVRVYRFADAEATSGSLRVAEGRDLVLSNESPLTNNLVMEGVLWTFARDTPVDARRALAADIAFTSVPLLYREGISSGTQLYRVNLALASSNITRHTAWPVLMMNIIEEARGAMPGISRTNLRSGEAVRLNLAAPAQPGDGDKAGAYSLWQNAATEPLQTWLSPPEMLAGLQSGQYTIRRGDSPKGAPVAAFSVNLFNADESNLQSAQSKRPDAETLSADTTPRVQQNFLIYYALLAALLACVTLGWVYQDAGH
jgi:hypothetical protein